MGTKQRSPVPRRALEAIRAFGGHSVVVTPDLRVVYQSSEADALPIVVGQVLTHPKLVQLARTAWRQGQAIVHHQKFTDLGPIEQAEVSATKLAGRCVLLTVTDLTATMRIEQVRHDLISNIGHELRTPVAAVQVIAETLDVAKDDPVAVERFSGRLKVEAERMGRLIEDILALAVAQDRNTERFTLVDLAEVVAEACRHEATRAQSEDITVDVIGATGPVEVMGDPSALVTAVDNLLDNAVSYSSRGSRVEVSLTVDQALGQGAIAVADFGIGIDPRDQVRIFERFYRSDRARSRRTGGTGLGLAIVKNVALGHGGTVSVRSRPGVGSTFIVTLPLATAEPDRPVAAPQTPEATV
ncbi:MAG: HAMP domain-containing histidine kinase [Propionibacteriaceae bacterium]|jgi:two-component system sensor histidine kinase SenX3|nr:HAMP domain-containing histidine kinase [Propionibacteriaceae bacterium]